MSNLYDDSAQPIAAPETLPLDGIIEQFIDVKLRGLRTLMPASITSVHDDQTIDAQPLWQVRYVGQSPSNMPIVPHVPVMMPQGATYRVSYPLAVGDTGALLVADRSLDTWLASQGGIVDPADPRAHALSDSIFVPGLVPSPKQTTDTGTDLVLGNGQLSLRLKKLGQVVVQNQTGEMVELISEAMQALIDTLSAVESLQVLTAFGPASVLATSIIQLQQIQARMMATMGKFNTFKSS